MTTISSTPPGFGASSSPTQPHRVPGLPELNSLLNFVPKPAFIADRVRGLVMGANHNFLGLTAYDINEILYKPVSSLLSGLSIQDAMYQDQVPETLQRRMRASIPVTVQVRMLDGMGPLVLVLVSAELAEVPALHLLEERISTALLHLTRLPQEEKAEESVLLCAEIICQALGVSQVAIYKADPDEPCFRIAAQAGVVEVFPKTFTSTDMVRLGSIQTWKPGKRVFVEIHRAGRTNNLTFVSSAPLGHSGASMGLLAIAGRELSSGNMDSYIELLAAQVTRVIEQHILMGELFRQTAEASQLLVFSRVVLENLSVGVLQVSSRMKVIGMNPAAEWMLGYAEWEVRDQPIENVLIGPDTLPQALVSAAKGVPIHNVGSVMLHRRNGQIFQSSIQTVPVGQPGLIESVIVMFTDDSEHEEIRQRSQQLEQRAVLGEVTAVFAHEVRNPINNIYTGLQVLSANLSSEDPAQENLARLQNDCLRLNHLMESVLNFSRTNSYKFERVDLRSLLKRITDRWAPRFSKVDVKVFFNPGEGADFVAGDARALEQVFTNLISNAVEAMAKTGGNLAIRMERIDALPNRPQVLVSVSDDGPGIPEEIRERIFEPFVTTKIQGTGLGLAITKRIVTAHHGGIKVNSFPGGTVFEVTLLDAASEGKP